MYHFNGYNISVSIEDKPIKNKKFKPIEKRKNAGKYFLNFFYDERSKHYLKQNYLK